MSSRAPTLRRNRSALIILLVVGAATVALGGILGWKNWRAVQEKRLLEAARLSLDRGELTQASLAARRVIALGGGGILAASRLMAEVSESADDADSAIGWRQRVLDLEHDSPGALMDYVSACLRFDRLPAARLGLSRIALHDRTQFRYLTLAGEIAFQGGKAAEAEDLFKEALALEPSDLPTQFALHRNGAGSRDYFQRQSARDALERLAKDERYQLRARRVLITSHLAEGENLQALGQSRLLVQSSVHEFRDQLTYLSLLAATESPQFLPELRRREKTATDRPREAASLLEWMSGTGFHMEGLDWVTFREPSLASLPELQPGLTACHIAAGNWQEVERLTGGEPWKSHEVIRHAFRTRAYRELNYSVPADAEWNQAISSAGSDPVSLGILAHLAAAWGWEAEEETILFLQVEKVPNPTAAVQRLNQKLTAAGSTVALRKLAAMLVRIDPSDAGAENDFAFLSLLLQQDVERASRSARNLSAANPRNVHFAATYALSLHMEGRSLEAVEVMRRFPIAQLRQPAVAGYFGLFLSGTGDTSQVRDFFQLAATATLLPEEKKLLAAAAIHTP